MNELTNEQQAQLYVIILRLFAERKGITQKHLAERSGLKQSNISRIFSLKYLPQLHNFIALIKAAGVNLSIQDNGEIELNVIFEQAIAELSRRPDK